MTRTPDARTADNAHINALHVLMAMGWRYVSPGEVRTRSESTSEVILKDVLIDELRKRRFVRMGETRPLSTNAIDHIARELDSPGMNEGLLGASERIHDRLTLGVTTPEFVRDKKYLPTIPIIDLENTGNNRFHVTERMAIRVSNGGRSRRPGIVCFVNGVPIAVIEAGGSDPRDPDRDVIAEGISRQIRNQKSEEIPLLYAYVQLLFSVDGRGGRYGTTGASAPFWAKWRERDFDETLFARIKNTPLPTTGKNRLFAHRDPETRDHFEELWSGSLAPTDQDRLLISLLKPERLLEFVRFFILFDRKAGKVAARYPQAFGVKRLVAHVTGERSGSAREGGVVYHAAGSGKSFTMAFLLKTLLLHDDLKGCRVIVATGRIDLEQRLTGIFRSSGAFREQAMINKKGQDLRVRTGKELAGRIGKGNERILFSMINKFNTASRLPECYNASPDIIVLVDQGPRFPGVENRERMRRTLPNAAFIAFTGAPPLEKDKTSNTFGPIVHHYTARQAVEDGAATPLLYEERPPTSDMDESAVDQWFDKITRDLTAEERSGLKQSLAGAFYGSKNRIERIALDIGVHFSRRVKSMGSGLKGLLAADSKKSAIHYKRSLDRVGLVTSVVVIAPPGDPEGDEGEQESQTPEVLEWWRENAGGQKEEAFVRGVLNRFAADDGPDILIVVDKLLTDLDEPRASVLYIDKPLERRDIIPTVARVNRLHEDRRWGLLLDYRGILKKLDASREEFQDPETGTRWGWAVDDIDGLYRPVGVECKRLPLLRDRLLAVFGDARGKRDMQQYRRLLIPRRREDEMGETHDIHRKTRDDFHNAFSEFSACLDLALGSWSLHKEGIVSGADLRAYTEDHRFFAELRRIAALDELETLKYKGYDTEVHRFEERTEKGAEAREARAVYSASESGNEDAPEAWSEDKIRVETDLLRARVTRTIGHGIEDDPYARDVYSERLKEMNIEAEAMVSRPLDRFRLFKAFEEKVEKRQVDSIPAALARNRSARAFYGVFRLVLGDDSFEKMEASERQDYIDQAFVIDHVVGAAVAAHSLNPENVAAEIGKKILPGLYNLFRKDMDMVRKVIKRVNRIARAQK